MKKTIVFIISFIFLFSLFKVSISQQENTIRVGTTFSQVQCEYFNMDWKNTYKETLNLGFDILRLGAYWYRIEKTEGEYNFEELDYQLKLAREKNIPVLLTVGMKAPRWPEYFIPAWLLRKLKLRPHRNITDNDLLQYETLKFIEGVIRRYKDNDIIYAWQVENEPLNRAGPNNWWIGLDFLKKEIALVRKLDPHKRPIVLNVMTFSNTSLRFFNRLTYSQAPFKNIIKIADIPAINVYSAIGHRLGYLNICFWSNPAVRHRYYKNYADIAKSSKKELWVTELQSEPWDPGALVHVREEKAVSCQPESFLEHFEELRSLGANTIFLWGSEYWIFRKQKFNDKTWINAGLDLIKFEAEMQRNNPHN